MHEMPIGEVAQRSGIQPSTIRYYEHIGLLPSPARVRGRRQYDAIVLDRLAVIRLAREAGFTLMEAKALIQDFTPGDLPHTRWRPSALRKREELEVLIMRGRRMQRILDALLACTCDRLEECGREARERARMPI
jgi:MerR family transcriptional regulator, redox-sensitive transcriptional activator SoxR